MTIVPVVAPKTKIELVSLLREASQLEHALCAQYLYAAFTLKAAGEDGLSASQAALNEQWGQQITRIAIQEMYHLMLASNLLTCLGATPEFARPPFPQPAQHYSGIDVKLTLSPFSFTTISRFLCWEMPFTAEPENWWQRVCGDPHITGTPSGRYSSVAELYQIIEAGFAGHPEWVDASSVGRQVTNDLIAFDPGVKPITTSAHAIKYVKEIVKEGEGLRAWTAKSHFAYFHQIRAQLEETGNMGAVCVGAWPTVDNPIFDRAQSAVGRSLIDDPVTAPVGAVFNDLYLLMTRLLHRLFVPDGETGAQRRSLARAALAVMPLGIRPLAIRLTRMPAGAAHAGLNAGPSFELPTQIDPLGGHVGEAFPALQAELLQVTQRCRILGISDTGLAPVDQGDIATIAARLETLVPLLEADPTVAASR